MQVEHTARGFEIIRFVDKYGGDCSLQQSSVADFIDGFEQPGASAIWFGTSQDRMHLDRAMLIELMPYLKSWIKTGSLIGG